MNATKAKTILFSILGVILIVFLANSCTRVKPGTAGIKINLSGNYRGTDSLPLEQGWVWYCPGLSIVETFSTSMQHVVWSESAQEGSDQNEEIIVGCKGGAGFKLDIGINYQIQATKVAHIYFKFKSNDLTHASIINQYIRNCTRKVLNDYAGNMTIDSMLNDRSVYEKSAETELRRMLAPDGFELSYLTILSIPRPTDQGLANSINMKQKAKQDAERTQTELQITNAEVQKVIAKSRGDSAAKVIEAHGQAAANEKLQQSLTPELLQLKWIEKWSGNLPTYMLGNDTKMMMQVPMK